MNKLLSFLKWLFIILIGSTVVIAVLFGNLQLTIIAIIIALCLFGLGAYEFNREPHDAGEE